MEHCGLCSVLATVTSFLADIAWIIEILARAALNHKYWLFVMSVIKKKQTFFQFALMCYFIDIC